MVDVRRTVPRILRQNLQQVQLQIFAVTIVDEVLAVPGEEVSHRLPGLLVGALPFHQELHLPISGAAVAKYTLHHPLIHKHIEILNGLLEVVQRQRCFRVLILHMPLEMAAMHIDIMAFARGDDIAVLALAPLDIAGAAPVRLKLVPGAATRTKPPHLVTHPKGLRLPALMVYLFCAALMHVIEGGSDPTIHLRLVLEKSDRVQRHTRWLVGHSGSRAVPAEQDLIRRETTLSRGIMQLADSPRQRLHLANAVFGLPGAEALLELLTDHFRAAIGRMVVGLGKGLPHSEE